MRIQVSGVEYEGFTEASVVKRLDALCSTFSFTATSSLAVPLPFRGGEPCKITVDGEIVVTGFIEIVNVDGSADDHTIEVQGRDRTADILDSSIASMGDIRPPISLKAIIERVISHLGSSIKVIDRAHPADFSESEDLAAPEPGDNAFTFIEGLARKRQVLLTPSEKGNLVIVSGGGTSSDGFLQHLVTDRSTNNVLRYSVSYDQTGRFHSYRSASQLNLIPLNSAGSTSVDSIVDQGTKSILDPEIRVGRQFVVAGESMFSEGQDELRAEWEKNIRRARGKVYSPVVNGYRDAGGSLWKPGKLVKVNDEYVGINLRMLTNTVTYSMNHDDGRTTTLGLVTRNAYTLELAEPVTEDLGFGFA